MRGKVKFYLDESAYGFIVPDDGGGDVFFHATAIDASSLGNIRKNAVVEFDVETGRRGKPEGKNVTLIKE